MLRMKGTLVLASAWVAITALTGCASIERATISFSYAVEAEKGLPPGMDTIAIMPAKVSANTDPKWSDMSVTVLQSLINESRSRYGTNITVTERHDTRAVFDEADLAAAGISTRRGGSGGRLLGAEGYLLSNINVKVEKHRGRQRTISGVALSGWNHGGYGDIQTSEVETVLRNMTVQTSFKLVDAGNGKVWEFFSPRTYHATDKTEASPIFGSSRTEAELTPQDLIIGALVERGAREFVSMLMPCRIDVEAEVESSGNPNCISGVRNLRAENFEVALSAFQTAIAENPGDHQAAFGAGVACEAMGNFDQALRYYKQACGGANDPHYFDARDRVKTFGHRVRR